MVLFMHHSGTVGDRREQIQGMLARSERKTGNKTTSLGILDKRSGLVDLPVPLPTLKDGQRTQLDEPRPGTSKKES